MVISFKHFAVLARTRVDRNSQKWSTFTKQIRVRFFIPCLNVALKVTAVKGVANRNSQTGFLKITVAKLSAVIILACDWL